MEVLGIEKYESEALNKLLEAFYAIVCKKDREDNECDVLGVLIIAVDRYLINKEYKNPGNPGNQVNTVRLMAVFWCK